MNENGLEISFPDCVRSIISRLSEDGFDSYAVGGCVRDSILGRIPHDWDITTAATPEDMLRIFCKGDVHVIGTAGIRHGTVMVKSGDDVCEVTTFRRDGVYNDHRRPDTVSFSDTVEEDLARRDFTVNAIAAKPAREGVIIVDPFGGQNDIKRRIIRTVGDPIERFGEDALRIMRAVRFSAELGFEVERTTADAAVKLCESLSFISAERVSTELWRTLCADGAVKSILTFREIIDRMVPGGASESFYKYADMTNDPSVRLALMLEKTYTAAEFFAGMRLSGKVRTLVLCLLSTNALPVCRADVCGLLRTYGDNIEVFREYYRFLELDGRAVGGMSYGELCAEIEYIISENVPYKPNMLDFRGNDAAALGIEPRSIGDALEFLLEAVQKGNAANNKEELSAFLIKNYIEKR